MKQEIGKKANMGVAQSVVLGLVIIGVLATVGANVISTTRDTMTTNTAEYNVGSNALEGVTEMSELYPLIGIVGGAVVVIGLIYLLRSR